MEVSDKFSAEKSFFGDNDIMALPKLAEIYFEEKKYPLTYYLADLYQNDFLSLLFYKMLSLSVLGKKKEAFKIYELHGDDWLNICKQYNIYWKHVIFFALYFKQKRYSDWFQNLLNRHYDSELAQLFELIDEYPQEKFIELPLFKKICAEHPSLQKFYMPRELKPNHVTFEKVLWRVWGKYNRKLRDMPLDKNKMKCVYNKDGFKIFSYKPHQVAASMHIFSDGNITIIFDCGAELFESGIRYIPARKILEDLNINKVDAVFISHGHFDHYGSLNELPRSPCFMTEETASIIRMSSKNILLRDLQVKNFYDTVDVGGIKIKLIPNGHIRGSVLFDIDWRGKRIIYTGDYCLADQHTCLGLDINALLTIPKRTDIFLTESTYGRRPQMLSLKDYESVFIDICETVIKFGKKIIIPSFAVGRAAEVALLLKESARKNGIIILIDGLAAQMTEYYQNRMEQNIIGGNISVYTEDFDLRYRIDNYNVIIASSGMLQEGSTSFFYLQEMLDMDKVCVMKVGFIREYESMLISIFNRCDKNVTFFDIPLSAHADYDTLISITEKISPETAIYIHGQGIEA